MSKNIVRYLNLEDQYSFQTLIPWTPSELSVAGRWDASDSDSITQSGGYVSQWDDISGNDNDLSQEVAIVQPSFLATGLNDSLPCVNFTTGQNNNRIRLEGTFGITTASYWSMFCVLANVSSTGYFLQYILQDGSGARFANRSGTQAAEGFHDGVAYRATINGTAEGFGNGNKIMSFNMQPNGLLRRDGETITTATTVNLVTSTGSFTMGGPTGAIEGQGWFNGRICEVVLVQGSVSLSDIEKAEGYLAWKWELTDNLPSSHPYKFREPTV
jgi:hypothetical protein